MRSRIYVGWSRRLRFARRGWSEGKNLLLTCEKEAKKTFVPEAAEFAEGLTSQKSFAPFRKSKEFSIFIQPPRRCLGHFNFVDRCYVLGAALAALALAGIFAALLFENLPGAAFAFSSCFTGFGWIFELTRVGFACAFVAGLACFGLPTRVSVSDLVLIAGLAAEA